MTTAIRREAPHHNTLTCYTEYKCRLPECVDRFNGWQRDRLRAMAAGTWQPYIDAAPVREHLLKLHAAGITPHRIEVLTGLDWKSIRLFTQPCVNQGRGMTRRTTPEIAAKILAIEVAPFLSGRVDATGTRRRLQALSAIGWPLRELGPHIGVEPDGVRRIVSRGSRVFGSTAQAVADAYDELRTSKPQKHGVSDLGINRALRRAKQLRWAPPKYWNQHPGAIDDPHFESSYGVTRREIVAQDAHFLMTTNGLDKNAVAARLGIDKSYIEHAFRDHPQYAPKVAA